MNWLKTNRCSIQLHLCTTISADVKDVLGKKEYDIICFLLKWSKSLFDNAPKFKQNGTKIGAFSNNTFRAVESAGLVLDIKAPLPQMPSMVAALEAILHYIKSKNFIGIIIEEALV